MSCTGGVQARLAQMRSRHLLLADTRADQWKDPQKAPAQCQRRSCLLGLHDLLDNAFSSLRSAVHPACSSTNKQPLSSSRAPAAAGLP